MSSSSEFLKEIFNFQSFQSLFAFTFTGCHFKKGSLKKKVRHLSPGEGFHQQQKKYPFMFSPFFRGGSNPKAGGWILDLADVVISRGCLLKLVSPSIIWKCAQGVVGGTFGEKKSQK